MKKVWVPIILLAMVLLCACGAPGKTPPAQSTVPPSAPTTDPTPPANPSQYTLTIQCVDEAGSTLATAIQMVDAGSPYTTSPREIEGYQFKETTGAAASGTMDGHKAITYIYSKIPPVMYTLTVKYWDEYSQPLAEPLVESIEKGTYYRTTALKIDGYTFKDTIGSPTSGSMYGDKIVIYSYTKNASKPSTPSTPTWPAYSLIVEYVDERGNELAPYIHEQIPTGSTYTTSAKEIDGYILKERTGNLPDGTMDADKKITYVYTMDVSSLLPDDDIRYSGSCGKNVIWFFKDDTLTIRGKGKMYNYSTSTSPWMTDPGDVFPRIRKIVVEEGITYLGNAAFSYLNRVSEALLPNSLTEIGDNVFEGCTALTSINIPGSAAKIGKAAFAGCTALTSIALPDNMTVISNNLLRSCSALTSIKIPDRVNQIGSGAFAFCTGLTSITIPERVSQIGNDAFYGCTGLTSVTIPERVTTIWDNTFSECTSLTSITIPDGVTNICHAAFYRCENLTSVNIPDGVTEIGETAFSNCTSLTAITIPDSVTRIGSWAFFDCSSLTDITLPDNIAMIREGTFQRCTSLTSVTIPDSVVEIVGAAFTDCTSLKSIVIPDGMLAIGNIAFRDCSDLTSVILPASLQEIGSDVFKNCPNLTVQYYSNPAIDEYAAENPDIRWQKIG